MSTLPARVYAIRRRQRKPRWWVLDARTQNFITLDVKHGDDYDMSFPDDLRVVPDKHNDAAAINCIKKWKKQFGKE